MARDDLTQVDGEVVDVLAGGIYKVKLSNGMIVTAKLSGKMRRYKIRVLMSDKVTVGLSPYDTSHGLITRRI